MKIKKIINLFVACALLPIATACSDFLDEVPSKGDNEVLNRGDQIKRLFANSEDYLTPIDFIAASTDDYGLTINIFDQLGYLDVPSISGMTWAMDGLDPFMSDALWAKQYNKVFKANTVLNNIDNVEDLTAEEEAEYIAHAHFVRGLAMWELVNVYCQPYAEENLNTLGLPLKQSTHADESMTRASLKDTYTFIETDLLEALKSPRTDLKEGESWLVSQPAANAILARFYLFTGNYQKAEQYADAALKSNTATLINYNNLTTYDILQGGWGALNIEDGEDEDWNDDDFCNDDFPEEPSALTYCETYKYGVDQLLSYQELYYPQFYSISATVNLLASSNLTSLYDKENDLRFVNLFVENGLEDYWVYGFNEDCIYHQFTMRDKWGQSLDVFLSASPTVAEMYLIKAEVLARSGNWSEALNVLQQLRSTRFAEGADFSISAANQQEALKAVLDERRREMPFVMRWYDIRRYAYNETTEDDVELTRHFYAAEGGVVNMEIEKDYVLPVKSKRYAQPILTLEIQRSQGEILQNNY